MQLLKWLNTLGRYLLLMGRSFSRPERMRMFMKRYVKEMSQLGVDSIGIVLLISFFIGAVICIQIKLNVQSPWMPKWVSGYVTREIMLLEFSSSIMCLILSGKVGSNIAFRTNHHAGRPYSRHSAQFQFMVHVDEHSEGAFLCLHHFECLVVLRLYS